MSSLHVGCGRITKSKCSSSLEIALRDYTSIRQCCVIKYVVTSQKKKKKKKKKNLFSKLAYKIKPNKKIT